MRIRMMRSFLYPSSRPCASYCTLHSRDFRLEYLKGKDKGIAVCSMNRVESRNALGKLFMDQMIAALDQINGNPQVRVVILKSDVQKVFCAGADLKERVGMTNAAVAATVDNLRDTFKKLEKLSPPTIAAIEGVALGGGLELALACDFRIAGMKATFGLPETSLGILPGAGGTQRLPRLIGTVAYVILAIGAKKISVTEALHWGLIDYAVGHNESYDRALQLAREITPNAPLAVRFAKEATMKSFDLDSANGLDFERACYAQIIVTDDRIAGLRAFQNKEVPVYKGE